MTMDLIFILLALGHIIGDFYCQPKTMAEKKYNSITWLCGHGLIYALCMASVLAVGAEFSKNLVFLFLAVSISHFVIDFLKRFVKWKQSIMDQIAHFACILVSWMIWGGELHQTGYAFLNYSYLQKNAVLIVLGLLCILKPVGFMIEQGDIWNFDKGKSQQNEMQKGAGKMIGYLERMIVYFLLLHGQFTAIAFVITAKSVARFPEIGKEGEGRSQAEYFLIGTLLSMVSVLSITLLLGLI